MGSPVIVPSIFLKPAYETNWEFHIRKSCLTSVLCGKIVIADLWEYKVKNSWESITLLMMKIQKSIEQQHLLYGIYIKFILTEDFLYLCCISDDYTKLQTFARELKAADNQTPVDFKENFVYISHLMTWKFPCWFSDKCWELIFQQLIAVYWIENEKLEWKEWEILQSKSNENWMTENFNFKIISRILNAFSEKWSEVFSIPFVRLTFKCDI